MGGRMIRGLDSCRTLARSEDQSTSPAKAVLQMDCAEKWLCHCFADVLVGQAVLRKACTALFDDCVQPQNSGTTVGRLPCKLLVDAL